MLFRSEMASGNSFSALISVLLGLVCVGAGQVFKPVLAESRQGNLLAGVLGAFVFCFSLTAISNAKMAQFGPATKSGLFDCFVALLVAIIASAAVHRIAITICVLFSAVFLFFLIGISQKRYGTFGVHQTAGGSGGGMEKRKK